MNKKLLVLAGLTVMALQSQGQGIFNFSNDPMGPLIYVDSVGAGEAGTGYKVTYYYAQGAVNDEAALLADGLPAGKTVTTAGTFFGGTQTLPFTGTATIQIRVWRAADGATWADAFANPNGHTGKSALFQISLVDSSAPPPLPPTPNLTGLTSFAVVANVPEPGTIALGVMGVAALLFRRSKVII